MHKWNIFGDTTAVLSWNWVCRMHLAPAINFPILSDDDVIPSWWLIRARPNLLTVKSIHRRSSWRGKSLNKGLLCGWRYDVACWLLLLLLCVIECNFFFTLVRWTWTTAMIWGEPTTAQVAIEKWMSLSMETRLFCCFVGNNCRRNSDG